MVVVELHQGLDPGAIALRAIEEAVVVVGLHQHQGLDLAPSRCGRSRKPRGRGRSPRPLPLFTKFTSTRVAGWRPAAA